MFCGRTDSNVTWEAMGHMTSVSYSLSVSLQIPKGSTGCETLICHQKGLKGKHKVGGDAKR